MGREVLIWFLTERSLLIGPKSRSAQSFYPGSEGNANHVANREQAIHDGYFYAADVGSAIHGNHIDVFLGTAERNPFPFIASRSSGTFQAYLVEDPEIARALWTFHRTR